MSTSLGLCDLLGKFQPALGPLCSHLVEGVGWPWTLRISVFPRGSSEVEVGPRLFLFHSSCALPPQEYKELKGDGPFTVFVPSTDSMSNMSQVHGPGRSLERGECSRHCMGGGDNHWLPHHRDSARMSWLGYAPIASLCFATMWLAAGSWGAKSCWSRVTPPHCLGTRCASVRRR